MKSSTIFRCLFAIGFCVVFFCAHQIPPSGGPDDKTPPGVLSVSPPAGTVNTPKNGTIVFTFAEWISPQNIDKCLSVFPAPTGGVEVSVSGRRVLVKPKKGFSDSTTYHIAFNTTLNDLHGNSIGTPYQHFFSTGPSIDSGRVFGCVILNDGKVVQPKVALYLKAAGGVADTAFFGLPSYLTQTDSSGTFSFNNIHRGAYEIIAFSDANNNNRLDPTGEPVFAPVEKKLLLDRTIGPLDLYLVECDTTTRHIAALTTVSSTCLTGEWAGGGPLPDSLYDTSWRVEGVESTRIIPIRQYITVFHSKRFFLDLTDTLGLAPFRLVCTKHSPLLYGNGKILWDTLRFNGVTRRDTSSPEVKGYEPKTFADLKPDIRLFWSRPVKAGSARWHCLDTLKNKVDVFLSQGYGDTTTFTVGRALDPDMRYSITLPDSLFKDINGNIPRDTQGIVIKFSTIAEKDICFSLSGGASSLAPDSLRTWQFFPLGKPQSYLAKFGGAQFRFDSIPAGKGRIAFFTDRNRDKSATAGSLIPWIPPEQHMVLPDTIEARARWDVEGISLTCETCRPKKKAQPVTPEPVQEKKKLF
jgi:hypothetical protein